MGERPCHLMAITPPPRRGSSGQAPPRTVAMFHFLKRFKVLENESIFQKWQHFSTKKIHFFLLKLSNDGTDFTRISEVFSKNYFEIFNVYETYKSREIPGEFYYLVEKHIKKLKK